ncbi:MAG: ABC transporter permease subunit [Actinobacteria bacterium]|nr:ABC transporter permease subunit [Actinomycetota bacterium]
MPEPNRKRFFLPVLRTIGVLSFWLAILMVLAMLVDEELLLPYPTVVIERFFTLIITSDFWLITGASLLRILLGFASGMITGLVLAVWMHSSRAAFYLLSPLIKIIRTTPVASFSILALIWITSARLSIFISFLMVLPIAWANTTAALESTDKELLEMAKLYRISRYQIWRKIYVPTLKPYFLAAAVTGIGFAWKAGITAEVIATPGLAIGHELNNAKIYLETPDVFVWTIVVVLLSVMFEKLLLLITERWKTGDKTKVRV